MTVCVIPARGGSKRILGKNIRMFYGKPLIQYSIEAAQKAEIFDHIIVSTDDPNIGMIAADLGAEVPFVRPDGLADDETSMLDVVQHALQWLKNVESYEPDYTCCLFATVPMITTTELRRAHAYLKLDKKIDYIVPIAEWLKDPGRWYFGKSSCFIRRTPLIDRGTRMMRVEPEICIDINTTTDLAKAEEMYINFKGRGYE